MTRLPTSYLAAPFAHRGLHDLSQGRVENSPAAIRAAVAAGYGIEVDVQLSRDDEAVVFHDHDLERLTGHKGLVRDRTAAELGQMELLGGQDTIPSLAQVLGLVAGRVPLLIEIKDQDGAMGPKIGTLEARVAAVLAEYAGPVAVMSFNPHAVGWFARNAPHYWRGLTSYDYDHPDDAHLSASYRQQLADLALFDAVRPDFISYGIDSLPRAAVTARQNAGCPLITWTVRNPAQAALSRRLGGQITFEGFIP